MGYLFYKGKLYADELMIDDQLDEESGHAIANKPVAEAVAALEADIASLDDSKQDVISDLATIRQNATLGGTAVQPAAMTTAISNAVIANPTLQGGESALSSIKIGSTMYDVSGGQGTAVVANPTGEATANLTKIQIGTTIYNVTPIAWTASLTVNSVVGATITVNGQSYTLSGSETSHTFTNLIFGQYTVTVTKSTYYPNSMTVGVAENISITLYPNNVPAQYAQLQYITSAGTANMDSGVQVQLDDVIETDIVFQHGSAACLFGDGPVLTANYVNHWFVASSGASYWGTGNYNALISHLPSTTDFVNIKIDKTGVWYNGTKKYNMTAATSLTTTRPTLKVFGAPSGSYQFCKCQMKHFSITDYQGILKVDWYPVIVKSTGAIGMFNRVSGTLVPCPTSGFTAGPEVLPETLSYYNGSVT